MGTEFKHPADEIASALARANGILTVIGGCYDKTGNQFEIGTTYIAESINVVDGLLSAATTALARLYQSCDLTIIRDIAETSEPETVAEIEVPEQIEIVDQEPPAQSNMFSQPVAEVKPIKSSYLAAFGPSETVSSLAERVDNAVPAFKATTASKRETFKDRPATSYDELLAKVTAVADQAAFQAHNSPSERSLLPALEDLRADLMKMRAVA